MSNPEASVPEATGGKWKAAKQVYTALKVTEKFETLRDRLEHSYISKQRLHPVKQLGSGAFAYVDLAKMTTKGSAHSKMVAVKVLKPELVSDEDDVNLFMSEWKLMIKLSHPYIVGCLGAGSDEASGEIYMVQEYCAGGSLQSLVFQCMVNPFASTYTSADSLQWSIHIAKALTYLHSVKPTVIHRDLKLENCLLTDKNLSKAKCKLADFGLAKLYKKHNTTKREIAHRVNTVIMEKNQSTMKSDSEYTGSGDTTIRTRLSNAITSNQNNLKNEKMHDMTQQTGSFGYMAPEVLKGHVYNEKADVFSFAILMYNLWFHTIITLHLAIVGVSTVENYAVEVAGGFRPPIDGGSLTDVPQEVRDLIVACWAHNPEDRPSMKEVVERLEGIGQSGVVGARVEKASQGCSCSLM
jgi:serine/threonine protein kinase